MQRASAAFGLLIFALWLAVLAVGLAYVTVWAATQRRPQWRILGLLSQPPAVSPTLMAGRSGDGAMPGVTLLRADPQNGLRKFRASGGATVISFDREVAERRRKRL